MKKVIILFLAIFLAACSSQDEGKQTAENDKEQDQTAAQFRNIDVTTTNDTIIVKGEAKSTDDSFFYTLKYGDKAIVKETKAEFQSDASGWGKFNFTLHKPKNSKDDLLLITFYVKNKAGKEINPNYVPVRNE